MVAMNEYLEQPELVAELPRGELGALLVKVKALEGAILAQLLAPDGSASPQAGEDRLLDIEQAAATLRVSRSWLYTRAKRLGLAIKLGDGTLRFSSAALQRFMQQNRVDVGARRRRIKAA